jgi:hypothetical protein
MVGMLDKEQSVSYWQSILLITQKGKLQNAIEQHILDANAGKQLSLAATYV